MNWLHLIYSFLVMSWTPLRERKGAHELRTRTKQSSGCLARIGVQGPLREGLLAIRVWILCAPNPLACIHSHSSSQGPKSTHFPFGCIYPKSNGHLRIACSKWNPSFLLFYLFFCQNSYLLFCSSSSWTSPLLLLLSYQSWKLYSSAPCLAALTSFPLSASSHRPFQQSFYWSSCFNCSLPFLSSFTPLPKWTL